MGKLNNYEVAFRVSSCGTKYISIKAKDMEEVIVRLKKKHYRTDIILSIREVK